MPSDNAPYRLTVDVALVWSDSRCSVNRACGHNPTASLPGDLGDEVEVGIIVQYGQVVLFGGRGDQQVGDLSATLAPLREESLYSERPLYVGCRCLDSHEGVQGGVELIPFVSIAS